jgi:hypothetical protein
MNRRSYLVNQRAMGLASASELAELASMPVVIHDGAGSMVVPPPLAGNTYNEKLADFCRRYQFDDREATEDEMSAFVKGPPIILTSGPRAEPPIAETPIDDAPPVSAPHDDETREPTDYERKMYGDTFAPKKSSPPQRRASKSRTIGRG